MSDTPSTNDKTTALIVGVGNGLSSNLARLLHHEGYQIVLATRNSDKLKDPQRDTDAQLHTCDATKADEVAGVFKKISSPLRAVVCNPSSSPRGCNYSENVSRQLTTGPMLCKPSAVL